MTVEFVVVDFVNGAQGQFAPGFNMYSAFWCIKLSGIDINTATGFNFDTLRCTEVDRICLGVFMLFNFGNVFAVVPFTSFIAVLIKGKQLALSRIVVLITIRLNFDFAVFRTDIRGAEQDTAVLIGIRCANAHTGFTRKLCSKRRGCLQHARVWAVYRESEYLLA